MTLLEALAGHRHEASWAIWPTTDGQITDDVRFPAGDASGSVHGRFMIVSLNPATAGADSNATDDGDWSNFHSADRRHNDVFLAAAFVDTILWGSYMTDLHPTIRESRSALVAPGRQAVEASVQALIAQARLLGSVEALVCVGGRCHDAVVRHRQLIERELGLDATALHRIPHYARTNVGQHGNRREQYRSLVLDALSIDEESTSLPAAHPPMTEKFALSAFSDHLAAEGWTVRAGVEGFVDLVADRGTTQLFAEIKGHTRSAGTGLDIGFGQVLRRMSGAGPTARFAMVVPSTLRALAERVDAETRSRIGIDLYLVHPDGTVESV